MNTRRTRCRALVAGAFLAAGSSTVALAGITTYSTLEEREATTGDGSVDDRVATMLTERAGSPSKTFCSGSTAFRADPSRGPSRVVAGDCRHSRAVRIARSIL